MPNPKYCSEKSTKELIEENLRCCCKNKQRIAEIRETLKCANPTFVPTADILADIPYTFTKSGSYALCEDIPFSPFAARQVLIVIDADDITLDLNRHRIYQTNTIGDAVAIQLIGNHHNITILNGTIESFTGVGIYSLKEITPDPADQEKLDQVSLIDLTIINNGSASSRAVNGFATGIALMSDTGNFDAPYDIAYTDLTIDNCRVNHNFAECITIYSAENLTIRDTQANYSLVPEDTPDRADTAFFAFGYDIEVSNNVKMINCEGNNAQDLSPDSNGYQTGGLNLTNVDGAFVIDSQFNHNFAVINAIINGANLSNTRYALYVNCQFNNNNSITGASNGVHQSDSPAQITGADSNKFVNCQFNGNSSENSGAAGTAIFTSTNIIFENCQASSMTSTALNATGFNVGYIATDPTPPFGNVYNNIFRNCVASNINSATNSRGFFTPVSGNDFRGTIGKIANFIYEDCVASQIFSSSITGEVAGITSPLNSVLTTAPFAVETNFFISDCRVADVKGGNPATSAGIFLQSSRQPVIKNNTVTDCVNGIILSGSNALNPPFGFQLALLGDLTNTPINLTAIPAGTLNQIQNFENISHLPLPNSINVTISPSTVNLARNTITSPTNLNTLGWKLGDTIVYHTNGFPPLTTSPVGQLINGGQYRLLVYSPGFTENALVKDNDVSQCTAAGYREIRTFNAAYPGSPTTTSAWLNNTAFNNGTNYDIAWSGVPPLDVGTLVAYPAPGNKYYNLDLSL